MTVITATTHGKLRAVGLRMVCMLLFFLMLMLMLIGCESSRLWHLVTPAGERVLSLIVEEAVTADERRRGLQGALPLREHHGLLLRFPAEDTLCIHNTGVSFAIDAMYIDARDTVIAIERAMPADDPNLRCHGPVDRVLEVSASVADSVAVGDFMVED